jgi:hypothetical protein
VLISKNVKIVFFILIVLMFILGGCDGIATYEKGAMESQIIDYAALFSFWIRMRFHTTIPMVISVRTPMPIHFRYFTQA